MSWSFLFALTLMRFFYRFIFVEEIKMTNFQVYRKVLSFSLVQFLVDLFALVLFFGCAVGGFFIADRGPSSRALIGLIIGVVVGIILCVAISYLISNRIKAAQISMMVKGVTEGKLPDHTFSEGFKQVKGRFGKLTLLFFVLNAIKGVFRQIGNGITRFGNAVGGDVGGSIGSAIDSAIQILIGYLCDCCLGWVIYRKEKSTASAACEGAVIFFKHGKTLIRNVGRIFGMGFLSFLVIGGGFFGITYAIFAQFPGAFTALINEIVEASKGGDPLPEFITNPMTFTIFVAAIVGVVMWSMIHSVLVRPFILTGVMRNFMNAGIKEKLTEEDFKALERKSPRFAKLRTRAD